MSHFLLRRFVMVAGIGLLAACEGEPTAPSEEAGSHEETRAYAQVDHERLVNADEEPGQWMAYNRTYKERHYSPLDQINVDNVDELGMAWSFDLETDRGVEVTPLVVDGVMYTTSIWNIVHALDAGTGEEIWRYDPEVRRDWIRYACCDAINRGVALWKGKVYVGTIDGRLLALDAATGDLLWEVQTTPTDQPYSITGAPRVVKDKVIIGNGGAELGVRGYVTAYDAETGQEVWRFWTVPGNPEEGFESPVMEKAAETWTGEWWESGGGGTVWDNVTYDAELDQLYIGTGNGAPWSRKLRSPEGGDNLFLASIVAVDPDTGEYLWHYQEVPGENWDYNSTQQMTLTELEIDGETRKVILHAPKNGFFYVIDRTNGELISANNFVPTTWASHIDAETGRPVEIEENLYGTEPKLVSPAPFGAHTWQSMSYSLETGLVYIPAQDTEFIYSYDPDWHHKKMAWNLAQNPNAGLPEPGELSFEGMLVAWDPVANEEVWRVNQSGAWDGGVLATAGNLLFQGESVGGLFVRNAETGDLLRELPLQTAAVAGPISYTVDGEQYVAVAAGWGGSVALVGNDFLPIHRNTPSRIIAFKLGGTAELPPLPEPEPIPEQPESTASEETIEEGAGLYAQYCGNCHGWNAVSGGTIPDLRFMAPETHENFNDIVLQGKRLEKGMAPFAGDLSEAQVEAIHAYVIARANKTLETMNAAE